jgi:phytoene synthase
MSAGRSRELAAAYAYCRSVAKREAKNFYYAFLALPSHKSDAMCAVYTFMRKADDLADDESISIESRRAAMSAWKDSWRAARAADTAITDPIFLALNDTQERFSISDDLLEHLVAGTTLDLEPQPKGVRLHKLSDGRTVQIYESMEALERYCYLVASVVGLVCIHIFGYIDPSAEQMAIDTGIAFQLTNILRDVKEDAERGRIYLPEDLLNTHGVTPDRIIALAAGAAVRPNELALLKDVEQRAATLYRSGYTGSAAGC